MTVDYDSRADVLYVAFGRNRSAVGVELEEGVVLRVDPDTRELVGITIVGLLRRP
jgi:uncharacterized protein YuzE